MSGFIQNILFVSFAFSLSFAWMLARYSFRWFRDKLKLVRCRQTTTNADDMMVQKRWHVLSSFIEVWHCIATFCQWQLANGHLPQIAYRKCRERAEMKRPQKSKRNWTKSENVVAHTHTHTRVQNVEKKRKNRWTTQRRDREKQSNWRKRRIKIRKDSSLFFSIHIFEYVKHSTTCNESQRTWKDYRTYSWIYDIFPSHTRAYYVIVWH